MICKNCKTEFEGRNFGMVEKTGQAFDKVDICSVDCRAAYRIKREAAQKKRNERPLPKNRKGWKPIRTK